MKNTTLTPLVVFTGNQTSEDEIIWTSETSWMVKLCFNLLGYGSLLLPLLLVKLLLRHFKYVNNPLETNLAKKALNFFYYGKAVSGHDMNSKVSDSEETQDSPNMILFKKAMNLILAVAGLWGTLISAGLLQEKIFKKPYYLDSSTSIYFNSSNSNFSSGENETSEFPESDYEHYKDSQFIIFFNRFFSALLAGFFLLFQAEFKSRAGFFDYSFVSISNVLSAWFQYEALKLVNFTTVVLFKGSRILPVMIMGRIISKTKNSAFDWITAVLLCVGSVMFMVSKDINADNKGYENIISGIVCLILYVTFDAFTSNWQQRLYKFDISIIEMSFGVSLFSTLLCLLPLLQQSDLQETIEFSKRHPDFITDLILIGIFSAFSQIFIAFTIKNFGAVVFVIIMTTRSIPQVIFSWLVYHHYFGIFGWIGIAITFLTIGARIVNTVRKIRAKTRKANQEKKSRSRLLSDRRLESEMTMQEEISSSGSDIESNPDKGLMLRLNDEMGDQMSSHASSLKNLAKV